MKNVNKKHTRGFTLVELLVVIAIIALLLSILMPSLNKAREQGRKIQCAAHTRVMALGMQMYAMTYSNIYPAMLMPGDVTKQPMNMYGKLMSYWHDFIIKFTDNKGLIRCPSLTVSKHLLNSWSTGTYITGLGLNYNGWNWKTNWPANGADDPDGGFGYVVPFEARGGCVSNFRLRRPGDFIMLGDTNGNKQTDLITQRANYTFGIIGPPRNLGRLNTLGDMPNIHNNGGNIAFMDTHIQWYKTTDLLSDKMINNWKRGNK
jgi:prepilin-type N-terminal cleavage/methylation domain-containing protein/prepilin-type processing-associated H-X9-DG protein